MLTKLLRPRNIVLLVLLLAVAALSYGFAAQLTINSSETIVGSGSEALTAYDVDLDWELGATPNVDPIAHLDFAAYGHDATEVYLGYSADNSTWNWITCTDADTNDVWDCAFSGSVAVDTINYVQAVAAGAN
jgi:hypothetical protein